MASKKAPVSGSSSQETGKARVDKKQVSQNILVVEDSEDKS